MAPTDLILRMALNLAMQTAHNEITAAMSEPADTELEAIITEAKALIAEGGFDIDKLLPPDERPTAEPPPVDEEARAAARDLLAIAGRASQICLSASRDIAEAATLILKATGQLQRAALAQAIEASKTPRQTDADFWSGHMASKQAGA